MIIHVAVDDREGRKVASMFRGLGFRAVGEDYRDGGGVKVRKMVRVADPYPELVQQLKDLYEGKGVRFD